MPLFLAARAHTAGVPMRPDLLAAAALGLTALLLVIGAVRAPSWAFASEPSANGRTTPSSPPFQRTEAMMLVLLTLLGGALRGLTLRHSLWYDELWTVNFMTGGPLFAVTHQTGYNNHLLNSLLGSLLLEARRAMGGGPPRIGGDWLTLVRLPAFLFGTASIPALYITLHRACGRTVASLGALLLALSPAAIDLSAQTRGYSAVLFFTLCQAHALQLALGSGSARAWLAWLCCAVVGAFAHLYLLFPVTVGGLLVLGLTARRLALRDFQGARRLFEPAALMFVSWALLTYTCYAAILGIVRKELQREALMTPMARAHEVMVPLLESWTGVPQGAVRACMILLCALLAFGGLVHLARHALSVGAYVALVLLLPPILVEIARPHFVYMRFFAFALPAFLTLLACGMAEGAQRLAHFGGKRFGRAGAGLLCVLFLLGTGQGLRQVLLLPKQDYVQAVRLLSEAQRQGAAVTAVGAGSEYVKSYGLIAASPHRVDELVGFVRAHGQALVLDTDLVVNIHTRTPGTTLFLRARGGEPIATLPGRFPYWKHRWLDGDSDFKIYRLRASDLPADLPARRPATRR